MRPTSTALTSTLWAAPSPANTLVSAMPAARVTAVGAPLAGGALAPVLSTLMMRPQRCAFMPGNTARDSRMAANSLRSMSCCHSSSLMLSKAPRCEVPALLTKTSIWPRPAAASAIALRQPSAVPTSAATVTTLALLCPATSARARSRTCWRRATSATLAPAPTKALAMARPMPRLPPVIRALRPFMLSCMRLSSCFTLPLAVAAVACEPAVVRLRPGLYPRRWRQPACAPARLWAELGDTASTRDRRRAPRVSGQHLLVDDVVSDWVAIEHAQDIARRLEAHAIEGFARHSRHMRGGDQVREPQQRIVGRGRLGGKHIEAGASKLAAGQGLMQRRLVDDAAAGGVDEIGRGLHAGEALGIEHAHRLRRLRAMDGDEIGTRHGLIEVGDGLAASRGDGRCRQVRVVDQHLHVHGLAALGAARADATKANDQHGLAVEVERHRGEPLAPLVVLHHGIEFGAALGQRQHHEHGLLGNRRGIGASGHHQRDLPRRQGGHVDRVEADTDPRHHQHLAGSVDFLFSKAGDPERDAIDRGLALEQGLKLGLGDRIRKADDLDVAALGQYIPAAFRHRFREQ